MKTRTHLGPCLSTSCVVRSGVVEPLDALELLAFEHLQAGAAAGGDVAHLGGQAKLLNRRGGVAPAHDAGGAGGGGVGGNVSRPPSWAVGNWRWVQGSGRTMSISASGEVVVVNQGRYARGTYYNGTITLEGIRSTLSQNGRNRIRTYNQSSGEISDYVRLDVPTPKQAAPTMLKGAVIHVDRFGNLVTNFTEEHLPDSRQESARLRVNGREIHSIVTHYAAGSPKEPFAYFGSQGYLEIGMFRASAARALEARRGMEVDLAFAVAKTGE